MKTLHYTLIAFYILLQLNAVAQPSGGSIQNKKVFSAIFEKPDLKKENKDSVQLFLFKNKQTPKKGTMDILGWEPKFKFRLSHNLNIIFSYN